MSSIGPIVLYLEPSVHLILMTGLCLLSSKLEMLGSLQSQLFLGLAFLTFETNYNLTRSLRLLVKYGLGLSTESHLLRIITTLSLCEIGSFSSLVLGDLVNTVLTTFFSFAVSSAFLRYVHHFDKLNDCNLSTEDLKR